MLVNLWKYGNSGQTYVKIGPEVLKGRRDSQKLSSEKK